MPHDGLFVMIGGGDIKLADHFYSASSRNYAPLCYICDDWGWGYNLCYWTISILLIIYVISYWTISILLLCEFMHQYGIFVKNGNGGYKLSDHFHSVASRNYASLWYICQEWEWGYKLSDHFYSVASRNYASLWFICQEWEWGV